MIERDEHTARVITTQIRFHHTAYFKALVLHVSDYGLLHHQIAGQTIQFFDEDKVHSVSVQRDKYRL